MFLLSVCLSTAEAGYLFTPGRGWGFCPHHMIHQTVFQLVAGLLGKFRGYVSNVRNVKSIKPGLMISRLAFSDYIKTITSPFLW
jgi:hypothetical protein